jgi:uncharacterized protein YebE (UPF0316 family)
MKRATLELGALLLLAANPALGSLFETPGIPWDRIPPTLVPLIIFLLRTTDLTLATTRTFMVAYGRKRAAWVLGFVQASVFLMGIAGVLGNLGEPLNLVAYAAGFASGGIAAMLIERRIAPGHAMLRIISRARGQAILQRLHALGRGATIFPGKGRGGTVDVIYAFMPRRAITSTSQSVLGQDPQAYLSVSHVRLLGGGWRA